MTNIPQGQIRENIPGAPYRIGSKVKVVMATDETTDLSCIGKTGVIEYYHYSCGCGQTFPNDPMIGVKFSDDTTREFWVEELVEILDLH